MCNNGKQKPGHTDSIFFVIIVVNRNLKRLFSEILLIKALRVLNINGKMLCSRPKMEYNVHISKLVSILFFYKPPLDMLSLKCKYNTISVNASRI